MNELKKWVLDCLWALCHPSYWAQNDGYCPHHERLLLRLLDKHEMVPSPCGNEAKLGNAVIWVRNHPFASMRISRLAGRPSRRTIYKLREAYIAAMFKGVSDEA